MIFGHLVWRLGNADVHGDMSSFYFELHFLPCQSDWF